MNLVTGGTGLIGSHLLIALCGKGRRVKATFRSAQAVETVQKFFSERGKLDLFAQIEWVQADILETEQLFEAMKGAQYVYHCAGDVSFNPKKAKRVYKVNAEGTANVVNVALDAGIGKLCHVSSTAALGKEDASNREKEDAEWALGPDNSSYANSKHLAEMEVWRGVEEGLDAVIVNPAIVIGPGVWGRSSTSIFPSIYKGMKFYPCGTNAYVDARDVAEIMIRLTEGEYSADRYILVSENLSFKVFFRMVATHLHKRAPHIRARPWMGEIAWRLLWLMGELSGRAPAITKEMVRAGNETVHFNNEKIRQALNYTFIPVETSVADTCRFFLRQVESPAS